MNGKFLWYGKNIGLFIKFYERFNFEVETPVRRQPDGAAPRWSNACLTGPSNEKFTMQFDALQMSFKLKCKCNLMDGKLYIVMQKEFFFNIFLHAKRTHAIFNI